MTEHVRTLRRAFRVGLMLVGCALLALGNIVADYSHILMTLLIALGGVACWSTKRENLECD